MNLKTLKEYIPFLSLLSVFLIALGLIRQTIYYTYFGIQIQFYITVPELILVLSDTGIQIIGGIVTLLFINKTLRKRFDNILEKHLKELEQKKREEQVKEIKTHLRKFYIYLIVLTLTLVSALIWAIIQHINYKLIVFVSVSIFILFVPVFVFEQKMEKNNYAGVINKNFFQVVYSVATCLYFVIFLTAGDCVLTEKGKYTGTKIFTNDSTYVSDKNHFYIGKTQNYYFIYNRDSSTLVIPEREVMKFDLKTNKVK